MSNRITDKDLQAVVDRINRITNSPMTPYVKDASGKHKAQIGNYHLSHAYGGVALHRMHNEAGGVTTPINSGHVPKRELYNLMQAYINGLSEKSA
jgi:2,4-dienoyl-CoA reductase-like NADH-dependent reductase (Old Yellow Enzyme family)